MAEPTVQVPVSLIEELREAADVAYKGPNDTDPAMLRLYADKIRRGYPGGGSNLTAAVARVLDVVADALVWQATPTAAPPSVADMVPGTTFIRTTDRWTVYKPGAFTGRMMVEKPDGTMRYLDEVDPSTIRDVTPPSVTS